MGILFHRIQRVTNLGFTWQYKQRVPKTQNRHLPSQQWLAGFLTEPYSYFFRRAAHANGTAEQEGKKVGADPRLCLKRNCQAGGGDAAVSLNIRLSAYVLRSFHQTSGVRPGIATGATGSGPISNLAGRRSSLEAFMAQSHLSARPV